MKHNNDPIYAVIGLMSGTSLDGLDLVYAIFKYQNDRWHYDMVHTDCIEYEPSLKQQLKETPYYLLKSCLFFIQNMASG